MTPSWRLSSGRHWSDWARLPCLTLGMNGLAPRCLSDFWGGAQHSWRSPRATVKVGCAERLLGEGEPSARTLTLERWIPGASAGREPLPPPSFPSWLAFRVGPRASCTPPRLGASGQIRAPPRLRLCRVGFAGTASRYSRGGITARSRSHVVLPRVTLVRGRSTVRESRSLTQVRH